MTRIPLWRYTVPLLFLGMLVTSCGDKVTGGPGTAAPTASSSNSATSSNPNPVSSKTTPPQEACAAFLLSSPCMAYTGVSGTSGGKDVPWAASGGVKSQLESVGGDLYLSVQDKCGPFSGPVIIDGATMTVGELATGAVGCEADLNAQHMWLFNFLKRPITMTFSQGILTWKSGPDTLSFKGE
jgi:hypothetical protein